MSNLTYEKLKGSTKFLDEASEFLKQRTGEVYTDPDEIMSAYKEHFRKGLVNEAVMYGDLDHARTASPENKALMARMIDTFESVDGEFDLEGAGDYLEGVVTAPSTIAGLFTGGIGKVGAQAGIQAARTGIKALLQKGVQQVTKAGVVPGMARASAVGSAGGALTETIKQETREETGLQRQEGQVLKSAALGAAINAPFGAITGAIGKKQVEGAEKLLSTNQTAIQTRKMAQSTQAQKTRTALEKSAKDPLDKEIVAAGKANLERLNKNKFLEGKLSTEAREAVNAATMEMLAKIKNGDADNFVVPPSQRMADTIYENIFNEKFRTEQMEEILQKHNITIEEFSTAWYAGISESASDLGKLGQQKKMLDTLMTKGVIELTDKEKKVLESGRVAGFFRSLDRLRRSGMTSQIATTARNVIGGGYRLFTDALDEAFYNVGKAFMPGVKVSPVEAFKDTTSTAKFFLNQKEADVVKQLFAEYMPTQTRKLFMTAAEVEGRAGGNTLMAKIGNGLNVFNTYTDTLFKRAALSASLDRQLREAGKGGVIDVIRDGKFQQAIDKDMAKKAVDDALYLVYQAEPQSRAGKAFVDTVEAVPFLLTSLIPFPRFIANQMRHVIEHSGLMLPYKMARGGVTGLGMSRKEFAMEAGRAATGASLLYMFAQYRMSQPPEYKFNEHLREDGTKYVDTLPMMGSLAPFAYFGDIMAKELRGQPIPTESKQIEEIARLLGTPRFSTSFGITGQIMDDIIKDWGDGKSVRAISRVTGDLMGTFMIPALMYRDFSSLTDKNQTYIREMEKYIPVRELDGTDEVTKTEGFVNFLEYSFHYAGRNNPWITADLPKDRMHSATREGALVRTGQFMKQLTGMTTYQRKSFLQGELDRLNMTRYDLIRLPKDPIRSVLTKNILSKYLPRGMANLMDDPNYQRYSDEPTIQKGLMRDMAQRIYEDTNVKSIVDDIMIDMKGHDKQMIYSHYFREEWENMPASKRAVLNKLWEKDPNYTGQSIGQSGAYFWAFDNQKSADALIKF